MATVTTPSRDPALDVGAFWERHRGELIAGLIVLLIAAVGFGGYRIYQQRRAVAAAAMLAGAKTVPDYQKTIEQYPGTPASASAYLLMADAQRNEKKFKEANETLQTFISKFPQHELASTAQLAMAANLESMGKPDEALATLRRLVASYPKSFNAPMAMISEIRLLKEKNQIEEARRLCENFLTQYRDSYLAGEASRQLRLLKPSAAAPLAPSSGQATVAPSASAIPSIAPPSNPAPGKTKP